MSHRLLEFGCFSQLFSHIFLDPEYTMSRFLDLEAVQEDIGSDDEEELEGMEGDAQSYSSRPGSDYQ